MNIKLVRRSVREPIRKLNKGRRIEWGIELVWRRVYVPVRKLIRGRRIRLVWRRVREPIRKLNKGRRINLGIELVCRPKRLLTNCATSLTILKDLGLTYIKAQEYSTP